MKANKTRPLIKARGAVEICVSPFRQWSNPAKRRLDFSVKKVDISGKEVVWRGAVSS
jgi:hypothetical protein